MTVDSGNKESGVDFGPRVQRQNTISNLKIKREKLLEIANQNCERLRKIADSSLPADKKKLDLVADNIESEVRVLSNSSQFIADPESFTNAFARDSYKVVDSIAKSSARRRNVANQIDEARSYQITPSARSHEVDIFGNKSKKANTSREDVFGGISSYRGPVTQDYINKIKDTSEEQSFANITQSYKSAVLHAQNQSNLEFARDLQRMGNLSTKGSDLSSNQVYSKTPQLDSPFQPKNVSGVVGDAVGKKMRRMSKTSTVDDSKSYQKFLKKRDKILQSFGGQISSGGISSHIMNQIMDILGHSGSIDDNGMMDQVTFQKILDLLNDQKKKDNEGISDEILKEINSLNKEAIKQAKKESENEDSVGNMRMLQLILVLAPILGVPLLGPIFSGVGGAVFGSGAAGGIAGGAPALMTAEFLGPIGDVAGFLHLDEAVSWMLTDLPILSDVVGVFDTVLLSEPGLIVGESLNAGLFSAPLIPIAAAIGFSMYMSGNQKYHGKKKRIDDAFKSLERELDAIDYENRGKFSKKDAGGEISDEEKRSEFVSQKYELMKRPYYFKSVADFIDAITQKSGEDGYPDVNQVFSKSLMDYFDQEGVFKTGYVTDRKIASHMVAKLVYSDQSENPHLVPLKDELQSKFGVFFKEFKSKGGNLKEAADEMVKTFADDEKSKKFAQQGNDIFDSLYDLSVAKERGFLKDDELLTSNDFSDEKLEQLKAVANENKNKVIKQESDYIGEIISQYKKGSNSNAGESKTLDDLRFFNKPRSSSVFGPSGDPIATNQHSKTVF